MLESVVEEELVQKKNKKKKIIVATSVALLSVILIITAIICLNMYGRVKVNGTFLRNQHLESDFNQKIASRHIVFVDKKYNKYINYKNNFETIKNRNFLVKAWDALTCRDNNVSFAYTVDKAGLKKELKARNKKGHGPKCAKVVPKKKYYGIKSAKYGTKIIIKDLFKSLDNGEEFISLNRFVQKPKVVDADLLPRVNKLNKALKWHIKYKNGQEIRNSASAVKYKKGKVIVDDSGISKRMYEVLKTYDTIGSKWKYKDHKGKLKEVVGGTWGTTVDYDKEVAFVMDAYSKKKSYNNRKPFLLRDCPEKFSKTMIEVSIQKQHLWMYKNKKIIMESDVVTGLPKKGRSTPVGAYYITERKPGKYLKGRGYKTWVDYWMRLTVSGVGLHDAPWQPYFGKTRYLVGGSHGCINLPPDFAKKIYAKTKSNMTVVIN